MIRAAVISFPGTNCEAETVRALERAGCRAAIVWHREESLQGADVVVLPGGFSYGDYLRAGAIARFSPILAPIRRHAAAGGPVIGICNGFQILCEAGLLPGALTRNSGLLFRSRPAEIRVERTDTVCTRAYAPGVWLELPVAHGEGRYTADAATLDMLEAEERVVLRYAPAASGPRGNPNGSAHDIAGICNAEGTIVGMMPHPERAIEGVGAGGMGFGFFQSIVATVAPHDAAATSPLLPV